MIKIAISQAAFGAIASTLALGIILLAAPACAGSRFGGFHGAGSHGGRFHGGGFHAFHRSGGRVRVFFGGYPYGCGYNCGFGFDSGGYDYGNGYDNGGGYGYGGGNGYGYGGGNGDGYGGGAGYDVRISNGLSGGPVGAEIPPLIIPKNCWVRRAAYDPSGAYFGQVLVDLCRPSDRVTATGMKARSKTPEPGPGHPAIDEKTP